MLISAAICQLLLYFTIERFILVPAKPGELNISLSLSTTDIAVVREMKIYSWVSLVGDLGGSLGLALGFSLLTIWDYAIILIQCFKEKIL